MEEQGAKRQKRRAKTVFYYTSVQFSSRKFKTEGVVVSIAAVVIGNFLHTFLTYLVAKIYVSIHS